LGYCLWRILRFRSWETLCKLLSLYKSQSQ
jgi:hypothetical protein